MAPHQVCEAVRSAVRADQVTGRRWFLLGLALLAVAGIAIVAEELLRLRGISNGVAIAAYLGIPSILMSVGYVLKHVPEVIRARNASVLRAVTLHEFMQSVPDAGATADHEPPDRG